jgi:hypothetical protein
MVGTPSENDFGPLELGKTELELVVDPNSRRHADKQNQNKQTRSDLEDQPRAERAALAVAVGGLGRHVRRRAPAVYRLCR